MNEQELREKITIREVSHSETAWVRDIELEYEGKSYDIKLSWSYADGYEIEGLLDIPVEGDEELDVFYSTLDELSEADLKAGGWRGGGF
jgi:hypothetical protein